jgi:hypothetical protein
MHHPIQYHRRRLQELHESRAELAKQLDGARQARASGHQQGEGRYRNIRAALATVLEEIALEDELLKEAIAKADGPERAQAREDAREASQAALAALRKREALGQAIDAAADQLRAAMRAYLDSEAEALEPATLAARLALPDSAVRLRLMPGIFATVQPTRGLYQAAISSLLCSLLDGYRGGQAILAEAWGVGASPSHRVSFTEAAQYSAQAAERRLAELGAELAAEEASLRGERQAAAVPAA